MKLEFMASVDSTSDVLKRRAAAGGLEEVALRADVQTGGHGRLGRRWESPAGNLYLSALLRPGRIRSPGHWSILAAVVLTEALAPYVPSPSLLRLKWPNDLMLDGGKLAGILLEGGDDEGPWLLIGWGVNLKAAPVGLDRATVALSAVASPPPTPDALAQDVLARLETWRERYKNEGFEPIRAAWLERGPEPGEPVTATFGDRRVEGAFSDLASSGGLRLDTPTGPRTIMAGELF